MEKFDSSFLKIQTAAKSWRDDGNVPEAPQIETAGGITEVDVGLARTERAASRNITQITRSYQPSES